VSENVSAARIYSKINEDLSAGGFDVRAEDIIDIIGGCHGEGYGISSQEELGKYQMYKLYLFCDEKETTETI